ncbi:MAG: glycoside hydrolase family 32 protein [bacterium]
MNYKCIYVGMLGLELFASSAFAVAWKAPDVANMSPEEQKECFRKNREELASDPYRPLYHFSPPGYGTHDAAGLCWWQGKYHFFYLFQVPGVQWGRGHAVSDDLVHWQDLPMLPKDIHGGTGQVCADKDRVILSVAAAKGVATASDSMLLDWTLHPISGGGDNCLWREGEYYYLVNQKSGKKPGLVIKRSKDMTQWESMGDYLQDDFFTDPGTDCACPNVLPFGNGKHLVLFFSHNQGPKYYIGTSDLTKGRFAIEKQGRMNYGPVMRGSLHAPSGFVDPKGRCIGMWNIFECLIKENFCGTSKGVISLPRQLSLNDENTLKARSCSGRYPELNPLCITPVEELKTLRFNPVKLENVAIPANGEKLLPGVQGRAMELEAVIDPRQAREVGLRVLRSPNGEEQTTISLSMHAWAWPWTSNKRELMIDVSQASFNPDVASRSPEVGPLYLEDGEPLRLRVFIDRSIIEVFANGRQCLTLRAYPTQQDSTGVSVFARGSDANLVSLEAHQMRSIWPELKAQEGK